MAACELAIRGAQTELLAWKERKNKKKCKLFTIFCCGRDDLQQRHSCRPRKTHCSYLLERHLLDKFADCVWALFFFPGIDPVKYIEGQMLLLVFLHRGQLESFSVTKHTFAFCHSPLRELTVGTWDLVLFSLTADHISLLQHTAKWRPFWVSEEDILLNMSVFAIVELFSCPW